MQRQRSWSLAGERGVLALRVTTVVTAALLVLAHAGRSDTSVVAAYVTACGWGACAIALRLLSSRRRIRDAGVFVDALAATAMIGWLSVDAASPAWMLAAIVPAELAIRHAAPGAAVGGGSVLIIRGLADALGRLVYGHGVDLSTVVFRLGAGGFVIALAAVMWRVLVVQRREVDEAVKRVSELDSLGEVVLRQAGHDLRTPLTVIQGFAQTLTRFPDLPDAKRMEFLEAIQRHCARLVGLADDINDVTKLRDRGLKLDACDVRVLDVVERAVISADVPASVDVPPSLSASLDAVRVEQVLFELLRNASEHGSYPIHIKAERKWGSVLLSVTDSGPGIDPADRERVFEPYFGTRHDGGGLGLTFARLTVDAHGGSLYCTPNEPSGTAFVAAFPTNVPTSRATAPLDAGMQLVQAGVGVDRSDEVLDACEAAMSHLDDALDASDIDARALLTQVEADTVDWPDRITYETWCAWHACRVALRRAGRTRPAEVAAR